MSKEIQGIIRVDGTPHYYLYDKEIEELIVNFYRDRLRGDITVELNSPPLKSDKVKRK